MGLKWFRARFTLSQKSKNLPKAPEFYRSMSQFDSAVEYPPSQAQQSSSPREKRDERSIHSVPTSPGSLAYNSMAASNSQSNENSGANRGKCSKETLRREPHTSSDEELSRGDDNEILRHLPRESVEIIREERSKSSTPQMSSNSRRGEFKKKKAKAPIPNSTSNGINGNISDDSEVEI